MISKLHGDIIKLQKFGLKLHPLKPRLKVPSSQHGFKDASNNPVKLNQWFCNTENNVGVRTGGELVVIDFDARNGGLETFDEIKATLPETLKVNTSDGGFHLYYQCNQTVKCGVNVLGKGVDVKADGGYVVAPPSIHPSGEQYSFANWGVEIAILPDEILEKLISNKVKKPSKAKLKDGKISMGERNNSLLSYAGFLRRKGHDEDFILAALEQLNTEACTEPLSDEEVENIVNSVMRYDPSDELLSDLGNSQRFVKAYSEQLIYVNGSWYVWDGKRFKLDTLNKVQELAKELALRMYEEAKAVDTDENYKKELVKHAKSSQAKTRIDATIKLSSSALAVEYGELDCNDYLLNVQNGLLDLKNFSLLPHDPKLKTTMLSSVIYDLKAKCSEFDKFLVTILPSWEVRDYLQEILGLCLTGDISEQAFYTLYGNGGNGKSVLTETIFAVLGEYAAHMEASTLLQSSSDRVRNDIARLSGKRFVSTSEPNKDRALDESIVKTITGGEKIVARQLYKEHFEYTPKYKVFISANHHIAISGVDDGIWRRVKVINFPVKITEAQRDNRLLEKLSQPKELSGILNWMLEGLKRVLENGGVKEPEIITKASREYRSDSDYFLHFIEEFFIQSSNGFLPNYALQKFYKYYSDHSYDAPYLTDTNLGKEFGKRGYCSDKQQGNRGRIGLSIKPREQIDDKYKIRWATP